MDAGTLHKLTDRITLDRCHDLIPGLYEAFRVASLNTVKRRAMWFGQVLEESAGLSATTEFASGSEYEWRTDLGNTQAGDGVRFKGRGFIQLTGRTHYAEFSRWCHARHLVPDDRWFLDHPDDVASNRFAWLSAAFYWAGNHNHGYDYLNKAADAGDIYAATLMVNGGTNGYTARQFYYRLALQLGPELMTPVPSGDRNWSEVMDEQTFNTHIRKVAREVAREEVLAALHAVEYGGDHGWWTEAHAPQLHAAAGNGDRDRLHHLEQKAP